MAVEGLGSDNELPAQAWMPVVKVRDKRVVGEGCKRRNATVKGAAGDMLVQT